MGLRTHGAGQWSEVRTQPMTTWRGSFHAGYTTTVSGLVTLSFGAKVGANWLEQRHFSLSSERAEPTIALGSVLSVGGRSLPLVQVHLTDAFSLDGIASVTVGETLEETYMLGATFNF